MFVLVGSIFDRSGVDAQTRQLRWPSSAGAWRTAAVGDCGGDVSVGGISGSGPACATTVGSDDHTAMSRRVPGVVFGSQRGGRRTTTF
jgi:TRAP-type C4-dicarboxylate transport system permease large subunit